jgi:TonB family protein
MAILACGAESAGPSGFYIVSVFFSDHGAAFYYRITDVQPDGHDTIVRYVRVANSNLYCPRKMVQAATARIPGKQPKDLVQAANPCAVKQGAWNSALKKYSRRGGGFEFMSFGIVARCGDSNIVLRLPKEASLDIRGFTRAQPAFSPLQNLASAIFTPIWGEKDIFQNIDDDAEFFALQQAGATVAPELRSGKFDAGLTEAVRGNVGSWKSPSFAGLLEDYRGPMTAADAETGYVPEIVDPEAYRFDRFTLPKYPMLAMSARIQGKVDLDLTVNPATGQVIEATAPQGHPLLKPSALEAAKLWRFTPQALSSDKVHVTLDYSLHCR